MVAGDVFVGGGDQGDEALDEGLFVEGDAGGAAGPGALEGVVEAACGGGGEPVLGDGGAVDVAEEALEAFVVVRGDGGGGVEREAAELDGEGGAVAGLGLVGEGEGEPLSGAGAEGAAELAGGEVGAGAGGLGGIARGISSVEG